MIELLIHLQEIRRVLCVFAILSILLNFCATTSFLASLNAQLPQKCICEESSDQKTLLIDCGNHRTPNIRKDIEQYLESKQFTLLQYLKILNSPDLSLVPEGVCKLKNLILLNMTNNGIEKLDPGCFSNMTQLTNVDFHLNKIQNISNGLFKGLESLQFINLRENHIKYIDVELFVNMTDWPKLKEIGLSHNDLETIDPWPLMRVIANPGFYADIEYNKVVNFTDNIGWSYNCGMTKLLKGEISLKGNQIQRLSNFEEGWGFKQDIDFLCMFIDPRSDLHIKLTDNRYICDCLEHNMIHYLRKVGVKAHTVSELKCHSPTFPGLGPEPRMVSVPLIDLVCDLKDHCPENCSCAERPENRTLHVSCPGTNQLDLPSRIPQPLVHHQYKFKLLFQDNQITSVKNHDYFINTTILDLSNNEITQIQYEALQSLQNATHIDITNNLLPSLSQEVQNLTFTNRTRISLYNNPWVCNCTTLWMKHWLLKIQGSLVNAQGILCHDPVWIRNSNMLKLDDSKFICGKPPNPELRNLLLISGASIVGTLFLFLAPVVIVYILRIWIYTHLKWHPFDWDECEGENKIYDIFISYAEADDEWVQNLASRLENEHRYSCCIHKRDFIPGRPILEQIGNAIDHSKRTLCILSRDFIESEFCIWEFGVAFHEDVHNKRRRLVAIKLDTGDFGDIPDTIKHYISSFTYLDVNDKQFEEKLLYVMPVRRVKDEQSLPRRHQDAEDVNNEDDGDDENVDREYLNKTAKRLGTVRGGPESATMVDDENTDEDALLLTM